MPNLKQTLREGGVTIGSWISLSGLDSCEIMAKSGFDWLVVDMEHTALSSGRMVDLVRIIDLAGVTPLVRVAANDATLIKHALDAGARGVIVPMVNSAEDARRAVAAAYYPPQGTRGVGLFRAQGYGQDFESYRARASAETVVIAQVEHRDAVECLDDILAVDGIDGFMIGPYDLSGSLGAPGDFDAAPFKACMAKVTAALARTKAAGGVHVVHPDREQLKRLIGLGYRFLVYGVDEVLLAQTASAEASYARSLTAPR